MVLKTKIEGERRSLIGKKNLPRKEEKSTRRDKPMSGRKKRRRS